jgi:hypothetical protein
MSSRSDMKRLSPEQSAKLEQEVTRVGPRIAADLLQNAGGEPADRQARRAVGRDASEGSGS